LPENALEPGNLPLHAARQRFRNSGSSTMPFRPSSCAPRLSSYIRLFSASAFMRCNTNLNTIRGTGRKSVPPCLGPVRVPVSCGSKERANHGKANRTSTSHHQFLRASWRFDAEVIENAEGPDDLRLSHSPMTERSRASRPMRQVSPIPNGLFSQSAAERRTFDDR